MTTSTGAFGTMYGFLACTASQYMTPTVITVERQITIGQLGALFEQHDFNAFPVMEDGQVLGLVTKFDFLRTFAFTSSQRVPHCDGDEPSGCGRNDGSGRAYRSNITIDAGPPING